jgi:hypothetical protein
MEHDNYPVSPVCPQCGEATRFETRRPKGFVAFTNDRVCKVCGTRYTPPTPRWAGAVWVVAGLFLVAAGLVAAALMSLPGTYLAGLAAGAGVRAAARLLAAGGPRGSSPRPAFAGMAWDAVPGLGVVALVALLLFLGEGPPGPDQPPGMETARMVSFLIVVAIAWFWTLVGLVGIRVIAYGVHRLSRPAGG